MTVFYRKQFKNEFMKRLLVLILSIASVLSVSAQSKKVLVAYFSCTGTTESVAKAIAQSVKADLYKIAPLKPYTSADLDWNNKSSRSTLEMKDSHSRPQLANKKANIKAYDVIFIGYPIWWGKCPTIINTFMEAYDFNGKTVIPFATSGGSSILNSEKLLKQLYNKNIYWKQGMLLNDGATQAASWAKKIL